RRVQQNQRRGPPRFRRQIVGPPAVATGARGKAQVRVRDGQRRAQPIAEPGFERAEVLRRRHQHFFTRLSRGFATVRRMRLHSGLRFAATALIVLSTAAASVAQRASAARPGYTGGGVTLLPNGWRIAPAGRHMAIGDLPLALTIAPGGRSLVVTNNGYARPTLRVVDLERRMVSQTFALDDAWLGLAF